MHMFSVALLASSTTTTKPGTSAGGSAASLIFILIIGLAAYFLFIRPRSQAQRRQREELQEVVAGDEVLTAAGIFGTVLDVQSDRITIETAPGTRLTVLKSTIARRIVPETIGPDDDSSASDHDDHHEIGPGDDGHDDDHHQEGG